MLDIIETFTGLWRSLVRWLCETENKVKKKTWQTILKVKRRSERRDNDIFRHSNFKNNSGEQKHSHTWHSQPGTNGKQHQNYIQKCLAFVICVEREHAWLCVLIVHSSFFVSIWNQYTTHSSVLLIRQTSMYPVWLLLSVAFAFAISPTHPLWPIVCLCHKIGSGTHHIVRSCAIHTNLFRSSAMWMASPEHTIVSHSLSLSLSLACFVFLRAHMCVQDKHTKRKRDRHKHTQLEQIQYIRR